MFKRDRPMSITVISNSSFHSEHNWEGISIRLRNQQRYTYDNPKLNYERCVFNLVVAYALL